jgi:cytoskeletal protein CcmA (bactofilin family)
MEAFMRNFKNDTKSYSEKEIIAILGEKTEFKGILNFVGTTRIDGKFEGEVITKDTLIVGKTAHIKAEISAGTIITQGKIFGNLVASKKVEIKEGSELIGNIKTPSLNIEENAIFEGSCEMIKKGPKPKSNFDQPTSQTVSEKGAGK